MSVRRYAAAALLAGLLWQPIAARAFYVRLTAPYTIDGTSWPAGTFVPIARDGGDSWLMRATTTSPRIPKSVSQLVPRTGNMGTSSVGIDDKCWSYQVEPVKSKPGNSVFDPADVVFHAQPYTSAELVQKEGDAYIIKMHNLRPSPNEPTRIPLHCVYFPNGGQFRPSSAINEPFAATDLVDDTPFISNPLMYGLAGGIVVLIVARFLIYGRG